MKILVICLITAIGLSGCSKQPAANSVTSQSETSAMTQEISEADRDYEAYFNEITIEGKTISFPCTYQEIEDTGFKFVDAYVKYSNNYGTTDTTWYWKDYDRDSLGMDFLFMGEDEERHPLEECSAVTFTWQPKIERYYDITFYGGISADSTREDVAKILDEVSADESSAFYRKYLDKHHHRGMEVNFRGDQVIGISIENYED